MTGQPPARCISRRRFLKHSAAGTGAMLLADRASAAVPDVEPFSFGLVTDVHYAEMDTRGNRHYRDSVAKLGQAVERFNRRKLPFVIELGDFIDAGKSRSDDFECLRGIRKVYEQFKGRRHFVLGNHCVATLTKEEFLANCGARVKKAHYSFDHGQYHFVVLDANFTKDGKPYSPGSFQWTDTWIHAPQQQWLAEDLKKAEGKKTLVFVHQNLDKEKSPLGVKNAPEVRKILEASPSVLAVFQGHHHAGGYTKINGIHYCTLRAMVSGAAPARNSYATVSLEPAGRIRLEGFGQEQSRTLKIKGVRTL